MLRPTLSNFKAHALSSAHHNSSLGRKIFCQSKQVLKKLIKLFIGLFADIMTWFYKVSERLTKIHNFQKLLIKHLPCSRHTLELLPTPLHFIYNNPLVGSITISIYLDEKTGI